jgi:hypothetical protein
MQNWKIDFHGVEGTRRLRSAIEERIAELAQSYEAIETCRVVATGPKASKRQGLYEVDIGFTLVDGRDLNIGRGRGTDKRYEDIGFAIDDTFRRARRRLRDHLRGGAGKRGHSKDRTPAPAPAPAPEPESAVAIAASPQSASAPAEAADSATIPPSATDSRAEFSEAIVSDDVLRYQDELTRDTGAEPLVAETVATVGEEPALAADAAVGPAPAETAAAETAPAEVAAAEAAQAEVAAAEAAPAEAAPTENAHAEVAAETAPAEAAAAAAVALEQATSLSPLLVAIAFGTALTAAATLNAAATWARLLKGAVEGESDADDNSDENSEAQRDAGGDRPARSD